MVKAVAQHYLSELKQVIDSLSLEKLAEVINLILTAYEKEQQIFVFGNGGSGSTASHFACDINKGVSWSLKKRFRLICLNDSIPTILACANDKSYEDIFVEQLENFLNPKDLVIGISSSGNSKNVIKAIQYSNKNGAESVAFTGFNGGKLAAVARISLVVPVNDVQKVEDIHLVLCHLIMQILYNKLGKQSKWAKK